MDTNTYEEALRAFILSEKRAGRTLNQLMRQFGSYLGRQKDEQSRKLLDLHRQNLR
ncbi:10092_t:CDS:1, partial [Paraglomus brasilianum]